MLGPQVHKKSRQRRANKGARLDLRIRSTKQAAGHFLVKFRIRNISSHLRGNSIFEFGGTWGGRHFSTSPDAIKPRNPSGQGIYQIGKCVNQIRSSSDLRGSKAQDSTPPRSAWRRTRISPTNSLCRGMKFYQSPRAPNGRRDLWVTRHRAFPQLQVSSHDNSCADKE